MQASWYICKDISQLIMFVNNISANLARCIVSKRIESTGLTQGTSGGEKSATEVKAEVCTPHDHLNFIGIQVKTDI